MAGQNAPSKDAGTPDRWAHYPKPAKPPATAPNVLLILTDDVGFGACSTFGGLIPTPALDRLAAMGIKYNAFHTTAMCSPTRAALLTGRNHHLVGFGAISNFSVDAPAYTSVLPKSAATMARVLRDSGYDTAMFGKNHNTPEWELGPLGPFDRWPVGLGFNYFYGFNACQADQFNPALIENLNSIRPPADQNYHLDKDLADRAINWFQVQKAIRPDHPFFIYWAPGTLHEPHQAPRDWIEKFSGRFDLGWDELRRQVYERQKSTKVFPEDAVLTERPTYIPAWESLPEDERRLYARQMEVAAAQLSHFDFQFGRVLDALEEQGQLDNTLVIFIQGDNGAAQEWEFGSTNSDLFGLREETPELMLPKLDALGGPDVHGVYCPGWGWAMNAPLAESKQVASHLGGIRNGLVISWPNRIKARGEVRSQFGHVIDVAPTVFEAIGITPPAEVDGIEQQPIEGISLFYSFDNPEAADRHVEQYFEMLGNRGLYQSGWMASTLPPTPPYSDGSGYKPEDFDWALYDLNIDWSQSADISREHPDRLAALKLRFDEYAEQYSIYPLANDQVARMYGDFRPLALSGSGPRAYPPGPTRYRGSSFPQVKPGWKGTATMTLDTADGTGMIFSSGSRLSGVRMSVEKGVPLFVLNPTGSESDMTVVRSVRHVMAGENTVEVRVGTDRVTMWLNGDVAGSAPLGMIPNQVTPESFVGEHAIDDGDFKSAPGFRMKSLIVDVEEP